MSFVTVCVCCAAPDTDLETEDLGLHLKLLSLLENPAVIVAAAASGDADTLRDFLRKHPHEVHNAYSECRAFRKSQLFEY